MKVVTPKEMQQLESLAYADGFAEADFMEQAGLEAAKIVIDYLQTHHLAKEIVILCGKGNNAGDGYVTGHHLLKMGYKATALQIIPIQQCSILCQLNHDLFASQGGKVVSADSISNFSYPESGIIVDAIFGTGFKGDVEEPFSSVIRAANATGLPIISIDIPSGLDGETGFADDHTVIHATETAFLCLPKQGFFLNNGWNFVGKLRRVDFGLPETYIAKFSSRLELISDDFVRPFLPPVIRNRHKYQAGYVVGLAGSLEMPGAALLSSLAALRGGAGIMRLLHPEEMQNSFSSAPFEVIKQPCRVDDPQTTIDALNRASAAFIGPGMGQSDSVSQLISYVMKKIIKPCVIDADALNILAKIDYVIPKNSILTPHTGEMSRLLKINSYHLDPAYLQLCQDYVEQHQTTLVLKGAPGFIFHPGAPILINAKGDPGMATAGSGDVLTGFLAALLAQGMTPRTAAALGVFLHGVAGEYAAKEKTSYCMIASDILEHFSSAFNYLY